MSDLKNYIELLIKSGKTEINSQDENKNLSVPQLEILTGLSLKENSSAIRSICLIFSPLTNVLVVEAIYEYMISQEPKDGLEVLNVIKKACSEYFLDKMKLLLQENKELIDA